MQPSVTIPGGDSTILTRNYFFEKIGDIRGAGGAVGASFAVSGNVGAGVGAANAMDADGQQLLEEAVILSPAPAAKKPPSPSKKVARSPSTGSAAGENAPGVPPPAPPAGSPTPAPKMNLNAREKDFFDNKVRR